MTTSHLRTPGESADSADSRADGAAGNESRGVGGYGDEAAYGDESTAKKTDTHEESGDPPFEGRRLESLFRETLKRTLEKGIVAGLDKLSKTDRVIRNVVDDVRLPREFAAFALSQMDETRRGLVRAAAAEIRTFLQDADLASEIEKLLTGLSFEIRTQVRFVPNEDGKGLRPKVRAGARVPSEAHNTRSDERS